ncbi:HAD family hydrolase [Candidatus Woesearchaeota archaeon CG_4_10_14_0_2_um_filter_33_13]|nr:MAG: HAD family hydrolase [Candidatus Woesearchaeota archaeon CG_4_10_14_0_2_um_filter_33_13]
MTIKKIANFLYETGQLKRVKRSGWWLINVNDPENVAEHSQRAAVIGYFLAKIEKVDVHKVVMMCLFNDIHEARLNDLHKVGHRYIDFKEAESKAHAEQMKELDGYGDELLQFLTEFQKRETKEARVARDADLLENAVQAKEYIKIGYADAQNWIDNIKTILKTESAKLLLTEIENTDPNEWWKGLKKIE